jgi:Zn-dependent peptidase ImmA (M78 family)/transcriptional regulator with XRE-family HTH domain
MSLSREVQPVRDAYETGERIRRLRLACGLGQVDFAERVGIANGSVSKLENGRMVVSDELLASIAAVVDCTPSFLQSPHGVLPTSRPWLRAYADAPKRVVDRQMADCELATEVIGQLELTRVPDTVPVFEGDLHDDGAIEQFAADVRAAAHMGETDVVGNAIRAAERLGCLVLPMRHELGRHLGMSTRADLMPIICVSRSSVDPAHAVPGDRQRFTVAHELGHLALHSGLGPPQTAEDASHVERQAHRFAGAFLAPGDAMLEELQDLGGRVTLRTLAAIKERWGIAIKALVMRFRNLGVIDADQARSLYKQISARGWNKDEPVPVGNEQAIWLSKAISKRIGSASDPFHAASSAAGIGQGHLCRWTDWSPIEPDNGGADVVELPARPRRLGESPTHEGGTVTKLPARHP